MPKSLEQEVFETLGIGEVEPEDNSDPTPNEPAVAPAAQAGDGVATPSPSPEPAAVETPTPAAAEPAQAPASEAPASPSPAPATPAVAPAVDEDALRRASLEATNDALRRELEELRATPQASQPAATETGQPQEQLVRYGLTLPKPVTDALLSDDPQQNVTAINQIVNDLGTIVHNSVLKQVRAEVGEAFRQLHATGTQAQSETTRETAIADGRKEYFKAFPAHENELILPLIQTESRKMAAEFPGLKWSPDYVNALGTRVNRALATLRGDPAPVEPTAQPQPASRPAVMMPSGQRSAPAPGGEMEQGDLIADTFDMFAGG